MEWSGAAFVLIIIGMSMFAGVAKSWIRASHGQPEPEKRSRKHRSETPEPSGEVLQLRSENQRLTQRLEASEDRLAVLERIVTDKGYGLAEEIEALRDPVRDRSARTYQHAADDNGVPLTFKDREKA